MTKFTMNVLVFPTETFVYVTGYYKSRVALFYMQVYSLMKRFVSQMTTLSFSPIASALYTPFPHCIHHSHTTGALLTVGMTVF